MQTHDNGDENDDDIFTDSDANEKNDIVKDFTDVLLNYFI